MFCRLKNDDGRESLRRYYLPIKDYNVMINGRNFFDEPVKDYLKTYDNIRKIVQDSSRLKLHNWMFIRLTLFQKILQINCNRFK